MTFLSGGAGMYSLNNSGFFSTVFASAPPHSRRFSLPVPAKRVSTVC